MPNAYHYFESSEVSHVRLLLEIELLKQLQEANLLCGLEWTSYDTQALILFVEAGIHEANDELTRRRMCNPNELRQRFEQVDFVRRCVQRHLLFPMITKIKHYHLSSRLIVNTACVLTCLLFIAGVYFYEHIMIDRRKYLLKPLDQPLTARRRRLSATDDLPMALLAFCTGVTIGCTIAVTRRNRKMVVFGILCLLIIAGLLIMKTHQVLAFLSKYRELRWAMPYDYTYA